MREERHRGARCGPWRQYGKPVASAAETHSSGRDNPINALLARKILESMGHTVIHVENGAQAVEAVAQSRFEPDEAFDIVLMDLHMPEMDGVTACERIQSGELDDRVDGEIVEAEIPPIIALTANAFPEDRQRCLAAGMSDFVTKPFEREHLAKVIDAWCDGHAPERGDGSLAELVYG